MAKNTNIIIQDGTSINSNDGWIYGIDANEQQCTATGNSGHSLNQDCDRIQSY